MNASAGSLYVADAATDEVVVFGPTEPSPPTVESESVSNVTSDGAILGAQINPRSEPDEEPTGYHFAYGRCATLDPASCAGSGYQEVPGSAIPLAP